MKHHFRSLTLGSGVALLWAASAAAGPTDAQKCEADKLKNAGKYAFCRMKADSKAVKKGEFPDYAKCDSKFLGKFQLAELKYGIECPTSGDGPDIGTQITDDTGDLGVLLSGGVLPPGAGCGNGVVEIGESCDGSDLNGETCVTLGFEQGSLVCTAECKLDLSGCEDEDIFLSRFRNNGDGTATDVVSGLIWEIKDNAGGIHDRDDTYTFSATFQMKDGTLFTTFFDTLNGKCDGDQSTPCANDGDCTGIGNGLCGFAGYTDWRLPNILELVGLVRVPGCSSPPCDHPDLPGDTVSDFYWSSTVDVSFNVFARCVDFADGFGYTCGQSAALYVRAVRGGL